MFNCPLIEGNRPVWIIVTNRSRNVKAVRQFYIDCDISIGIQLSGKIMLVCRIIHNVIVQMTLCFHYVYSKLTLDRRLRKDIRIIPFIQHTVSNMLNNRGCLFVVDQSTCLENKLLRIELKLFKNRFLNTRQNCNNCFPR